MLHRFGLYSLAGLFLLTMQAPPAPAQASRSGMKLIRTQRAAAELRGPAARRPRVVQVGFFRLYEAGHIPGAIYAGPARTAQGRQKLRQAVKSWPRNAQIFIYCGCCPMAECPNVRPAWTVLKKMGFRQVRVIDLPQNFYTNWIQAGLPHTRQ